MDSDEVLEEKLAALSKYLVADTYGNVQVVYWARDAYNARLFFSPFQGFYCWVIQILIIMLI